MKITKRNLILAAVCLALVALAYFAWKLPFFEWATTSLDSAALFSAGYWKALIPLGLILALSAAGIVLCVLIRKKLAKSDPTFARFAEAHTGRARGSAPKQKPSVFMAVRWILMIVFSFFMIFGGLIFGLHIAGISFPVLSCPWNTSQAAESSCYYLAHLNELFELPIADILIFFVSTLGFALLLGRAICGFLCPMGLIQDVMNQIRQKRKIEGITMNESLYKALTPIKWVMVFLFLGLCFLGGNFCNFCPAIAVSPVLAGMTVSLYVSGFMMVFVLIGSFFKRRVWCNICPLGFLLGMLHRVSLFRIRKDVTACTECGACYEACPMGVKIIYTEREKTDVTDVNCIMCGECIKKCPENNALSMTFAGKKLYTARRDQVVGGYEKMGRAQDRADRKQAKR